MSDLIELISNITWQEDYNSKQNNVNGRLLLDRLNSIEDKDEAIGLCDTLLQTEVSTLSLHAVFCNLCPRLFDPRITGEGIQWRDRILDTNNYLYHDHLMCYCSYLSWFWVPEKDKKEYIRYRHLGTLLAPKTIRNVLENLETDHPECSVCHTTFTDYCEYGCGSDE